MPESSNRAVQPKHAEFEVRFIWWALRLAILAGFALGAHVISVIGFGLPLGKGFYPYIQTHGHIQLIGWAGLFIIGISLHFIPRLAGAPLAHPGRLTLILHLITAGLVLRFVAHALLPYLIETAAFTPVNVSIAISGVLVLLGCLTYLLTLLQTIWQVPNLNKRPGLQSVRGFFFIMLAGWLIYPALNAVLLTAMVWQGNMVANEAWNEFGVQLFMNLVLLPVAFAFSTRMFPLYLRLPAIDWPVNRVAAIYFLTVLLQLVPATPPCLTLDSPWPTLISVLGQALKGLVILWFIWKLDLLTRRRGPWTVLRIGHPGPERKPTREGMPDHGEFGPFEKLVYGAYIWLVLGALIELVLGAAFLLHLTIPVSTDAVRHIYLLGFITQLILGVAPRMIPGFIRKKAVATPKLVTASFWLVNIAVFSRVVPLILPASLPEVVPGLAGILGSLLGLSGVFGIAAVSALALNLRRTARL